MPPKSRQLAMNWLNGLQYFEKQALTEYYISISRTPESLTGREIESLCPAEIKYADRP